METQLATFDETQALEQAGGSPELARELFGMLVRELPQFDQEIREAYARQDFDLLLQRVHKLNGAATYCGVPALKAAAHSFETSLKRDESERFAEQLDDLLDAIQGIQERAHERLG